MPNRAKEEVVTVLFLDIIGFSSASLLRSPGEAFHDLKLMFDRITRIVQVHGGTVDRTLGDGLLAYFTSHDSTAVLGNHADRALRCAIEIHHAQIAETLSTKSEQPTAVLPMRIGINTGSVYMGDLGSNERRDFTIIGAAVNLGQRLEAACEINRIMVGVATVDFAEQFSETSQGMWRRPIIAKSYRDPVDAFEYDPFINDIEANESFIAAFRTFANLQRVDERFRCDETSLMMVTSHGHATVVNVSRSGVMLRFDHYIARGVVVYVSQVISKVEHLETPPLFLEVRWGKPTGSGSFIHGCMLKNLSEEQIAELWDLWQRILPKSEE